MLPRYQPLFVLATVTYYVDIWGALDHKGIIPWEGVCLEGMGSSGNLVSTA